MRARLAFVVALAALVLINLISLVGSSDARRIERSPESAYAAARLSPYKSVRFTFAVYGYIRNHMAGKRLTIPHLLHGHTWFLQRVSRVEVDFEDSTEIKGKQFRALRKEPDHVSYLRTQGTPLDLYFLFGPGSEDHYVVAQNPSGADLIVMPDDLYEKLALDP